MTQLFRPFIGKFVVIYFDDILIYSRTREQRMDLMRQVLRTLQAEKVLCKSEKCAFCTYMVIFFGIVVSSEGVSADPEKVKAIIGRPLPRTIRESGVFNC